MKIRTDFVTNSSSSSFVAITITGETLARIVKKHESVLQEYFSEENDFFGGKVLVQKDNITIEKECAQDGLAKYVPTQKAEVISSIASMLSYDDVKEESDLEEAECDDADLLSLLTELFSNSDAILNSLKMISWVGKDLFYGEYDDPDLIREFTYTVETGESFTESEEEHENFDEDDFDE